MHPDQLRSRRRVGMMEIGEDSYGRTWRVKKDGVCVLMSNENAPGEYNCPVLLALT
jgi:hypothetical protein